MPRWYALELVVCHGSRGVQLRILYRGRDRNVSGHTVDEAVDAMCHRPILDPAFEPDLRGISIRYRSGAHPRGAVAALHRARGEVDDNAQRNGLALVPPAAGIPYHPLTCERDCRLLRVGGSALNNDEPKSQRCKDGGPPRGFKLADEPNHQKPLRGSNSHISQDESWSGSWPMLPSKPTTKASPRARPISTG